MTLPGFPHADGPHRGPATGPGRESRSPDRYDARGGNRPEPSYAPRPTGRPTDEAGESAPRGTGFRGVASRTKQFTKRTASKIDAASGAHGARESGLRTLIWTNTASMAGDALISVYLAATLFFAAPGEQQRGNVALYLLVTVAPFALLAPVIGPLLDRIDRGRRLAIAATFGARAFLCFLLATNTDSTVLLYICALLYLVFSRAFIVLKAAVVPRVLPPDLPLVGANSRMHVFGMIGAGVVGAIGAGIIKLFNSIEPVEPATEHGSLAEPTLGFTIELFLCAAVFVAGAVLPLKLPASVDTDEGEGKVTMGSAKAPTAVRISLGTHVVTALRSTSAQRFLGGFLTFFLVFYVQTTQRGFAGLALLAALGAAAGIGSMAGTALGTRLATGASPDVLVLATTGTAVAFCVAAAVSPSIGLSLAVALVAAVASGLGKLALDAIIQREVPDSFRSSAFSRSETLLQLAWVAGGTIGILLPTTQGTLWLGWTVAAVVLTIAFGLTLISRHREVQEGPRGAEVEPLDPSERPIARIRDFARRHTPRRGGGPGTNAPGGDDAGYPAPAYGGPGHYGPPPPPGASRYPTALQPGTDGAGRADQRPARRPAGSAAPRPSNGRPSHPSHPGRPSRPGHPGRSGAPAAPPSAPVAGEPAWLDTPAPTSPTKPLPDFRGLDR